MLRWINIEIDASIEIHREARADALLTQLLRLVGGCINNNAVSDCALSNGQWQTAIPELFAVTRPRIACEPDIEFGHHGVRDWLWCQRNGGLDLSLWQVRTCATGSNVFNTLREPGSD